MSENEDQDLPHTHLQFIEDLPWNKYLWLMTRIFVAELIGSALFILPANIIPSPTVYEPLMAGIAMGGAFYVAIWITYPTSGGHINPIISLTSFLQQNINLSHLLVYWFAQFLGAFLGTVTGLKITPFGQNETNWRLTQPLPSVSEGQAFVVEILTGCILVNVYLSTIDLKRPENWGLSTGLNMALPLMLSVMGIVIISGILLNSFQKVKMQQSPTTQQDREERENLSWTYSVGICSKESMAKYDMISKPIALNSESELTHTMAVLGFNYT
ncbi:hypothetical protein ACTXT7_005446 [Hymenolepis weldensis]